MAEEIDALYERLFTNLKCVIIGRLMLCSYQWPVNIKFPKRTTLSKCGAFDI